MRSFVVCAAEVITSRWMNGAGHVASRYAILVAKPNLGKSQWGDMSVD
jgi:hypothetical protein